MHVNKRIFAGIACFTSVALTVGLSVDNASAAISGVNHLASIDSSANQSNAGSNLKSSISNSGQYVVFVSGASNLVSGDTNSVNDIFVRDTVNSTTSRISVSSGGTQANGSSAKPRITGNGKYVVFQSSASNLVSGDTNSDDDVFVHNMVTGTTSLVSTSASGTIGNGSSDDAAISADGRFIAFDTYANNLSAGTPANLKVYVKDMDTGSETLISAATSGDQDNNSYSPDISCDGGVVAFASDSTNLTSASDTNASTDIFTDTRAGGESLKNITISQQYGTGSGNPQVSCDGNYVSFASSANNIVSGDTNGHQDIFSYDRQDGATSMVSLSSTGVEANDDSTDDTISGDGRYITFGSSATNLASVSTNSANQQYIRDTIAGTTELITLNSSGNAGNSFSGDAQISTNGKHIVYYSAADNLISSDSNGYGDIFYTDN